MQKTKLKQEIVIIVLDQSSKGDRVVLRRKTERFGSVELILSQSGCYQMSCLVDVTREMHLPYRKETSGEEVVYCAPMVVVNYCGTGLRLEEELRYQTSSDWACDIQIRNSEDNGQTWGEFKVLVSEWPFKDGHAKSIHDFARCYDPAAGKMVRFIFQRLSRGGGREAIEAYWKGDRKALVDHTMWQVSDDDGVTWSEPRVLQYEPGGEFNADNWADESYLTTNVSYGAYTAIASNGTLVYPMSRTYDLEYQGREQKVCAVTVFVGRWDEQADEYKWECSSPVAVPLQVSGRGLMEPTIIELTSGKLLMTMRGSTVIVPPVEGVEVESPGRHWMCVSEDGGMTWSDVTDLRYDTGEQFYSPSTLAKMFRHSNGKVYWVGNICPEPPKGNMPRDPLVIAEVDEDTISLKKDTVSVIDSREGETNLHDLFQLSNFSVFENRQTGKVELYLTRLGEDAENWLKANVYRYVLTVK